MAPGLVCAPTAPGAPLSASAIAPRIANVVRVNLEIIFIFGGWSLVASR
jgi:hypothetical protein